MSFRDLLCKWFGIGCPQVVPPTQTCEPGSRTDLIYCYFGAQDGQIAATAPTVNAAMFGAWGDWTTPGGRQVLTQILINYANEAVNHGIRKLIFPMDWCVYTQTQPMRLLPPDTAVNYLIAFCDAIRDAGLMDKVIGWYPVDEPNIDQNNISAADQVQANAHIRNVTCHYTNGGDPTKALPLITTYAERGGAYPGIQAYDWVGIDNYGNRIFDNGMYNHLVSQLNANQKTVILPGGADPWREDPMYYYNHAQTDLRVAMIMPFVWWNYEPGRLGIGFNGMQPQYDAVGNKIVAA